MRLGAIVLLLAAKAAAADIAPIPYQEVEALTHGRVGFNLLPDLPEPGHNLNHGYAFAGGRIGERFTGQRLLRVEGPESPHDRLEGQPDAPLTLETGAPGQGLSISFHRAFRSSALYPLGPLAYPDMRARGEGAAAVLLTRDACAFALKIHTEYVDELGTNTGHVGAATVTFWSRNGRQLARFALKPQGGINTYGFLSDTADIAGVTVENLDPGGISVDDIRFGCPALTG